MKLASVIVWTDRKKTHLCVCVHVQVGACIVFIAQVGVST